ncbi:MAG: hypothetical protein U5Q44_11610 [Dehalococcoidia bacterium]|nr:hypothetical protein [Dehalococcoidia bacterium]
MISRLPWVIAQRFALRNAATDTNRPNGEATTAVDAIPRAA